MRGRFPEFRKAPVSSRSIPLGGKSVVTSLKKYDVSCFREYLTARVSVNQNVLVGSAGTAQTHFYLPSRKVRDRAPYNRMSSGSFSRCAVDEPAGKERNSASENPRAPWAHGFPITQPHDPKREHRSVLLFDRSFPILSSCPLCENPKPNLRAAFQNLLKRNPFHFVLMRILDGAPVKSGRYDFPRCPIKPISRVTGLIHSTRDSLNPSEQSEIVQPAFAGPHVPELDATPETR